MKKYSLLPILLVVSVLFSGCVANPSNTPITAVETPQVVDAAPSATQKQNDNSEPSPTPTAADATIESAVLVDKDGVVVTAKEMVYDSIWGPGIKVLVENNSQGNIAVQCDSIIVNDYMMTNMFSCSVAAGKKANDTIYFTSSDIEAAGITTIADVAIAFTVLDSDSYKILFDTEEIEIKTSAYGAVDQLKADDGIELINQDGIRIIGKYVTEDSIWGAGVVLFIENNSGENVIVQCDNMSINGFMITPFFSCTVNDGRMALDDITIMSSDLEENDIEAVEDIELVFNIVDPDNYRSIFETEPIAFSTK